MNPVRCCCTSDGDDDDDAGRNNISMIISVCICSNNSHPTTLFLSINLFSIYFTTVCQFTATHTTHREEKWGDWEVPQLLLNQRWLSNFKSSATLAFDPEYWVAPGLSLYISNLLLCLSHLFLGHTINNNIHHTECAVPERNSLNMYVIQSVLMEPPFVYSTHTHWTQRNTLGTDQKTRPLASDLRH